MKMYRRNCLSDRKRQRGISTMEYIIAGALIAVASIAAANFFGNTQRSQMGGIASELAGDSDAANDAIGNAQDQAGGAVAQGEKNRHMDEYTNETQIEIDVGVGGD